MGFKTYIKETKHRAISKYSYLQKKVVAKLSLIQDSVFSKDNYPVGEKQAVVTSGTNTFSPEESPLEFCPPSEELTFKGKDDNEVALIASKSNYATTNYCTEGAQVIKIIIIEGKVVEKEYITIEGDIIARKFE